MITANIGRLFLQAYNEKFQTSYDAKGFFTEVYHPLFFDSNKYLQWMQNSPFVQMSKGQKVETLTPDERQVKLEEFHQKVDEKRFDASMFLGAAASEEKEFATTSGQVTNLPLAYEANDIYLSWIGSSLGVGVSGGLSFLFMQPEILLDIFDGWQVYRTVLNQNETLKGNQMNTWNAQWLIHKYSRGFCPQNPMANFNPFETSTGGMTVAVASWIQLLIALARHYEQPQMMAYIYNFGQTNTTVGFIPLFLAHIRKPIQLYERLFGMDESYKAEPLWGNPKGLRSSCKRGSIGLEAMEPSALQNEWRNDKTVLKYKNTDENQRILFQTYKIWLMAMLNNEELWAKSEEFAKALKLYLTSDAKKNSTVRKNRIETLLTAYGKKALVTAATEMMDQSETSVLLVEMVKLINMMPDDNVPYFMALIKFQYVTISNQ